MSPPPSPGPTRFDAGDPEPCECACHTNPMIQHFAACCAACERCGVRFRGGLAKHRRGCMETAAE